MDFVGRDAELEVLRQAWLKRDDAPLQFIVLVGESRIGKTRIVQEFYRWLNSHQDPGNYWPDTLETGKDSLHVNPSFDGHAVAEGAIPWLWWGLRWTRPDTRNPDESLRCAFLADSDHLRPHLQAAQRYASERVAGKKAAFGAAKTALNLITGGTAGAFIEFSERVNEWRDLRSARSRGVAAVADRIVEQRVDELDLLSGLLLSMTATSEVAPTGVPLILVLDDAHWADPEGLRFLLNLARELLRRTKAGNGFPRFLVVATVWEREWNLSENQPLSVMAESAPVSLSECIRLLRGLAQREDLVSPRLQVLRLGRLDGDLHPLVLQSLPGLTPNQVQLVAGRAGGSPGLLVELLLKLSGQSHHLFKDADPTKALTSKGEARVREMQVSYHDLVEERLQTLLPVEASVMRLASYLGQSYSRPFVAELAVRVAARATSLSDATAVESALLRADHPLAIVQAASQQMDEFRLAVYRDILRRQLEESEHLWDGLTEDATALARNWIEKERATDLGSSERRAFLDFAVGELQSAALLSVSGDHLLALLMALAEAACDAEAEGLVSRASQTIRSWQSVYRDPGPTGFARLGRRRMNGVLSCMALCDDHEAAHVLATAAIAALRAASSTDLSLLLVCLWHAARVDERADRLGEAIALYREAEALAERILTDFGPSAERLRDVFVAKSQMGGVLRSQEKANEALVVSREALALAERILAQFGPSPERMRDVSIAKGRLVNVLLVQDHTVEIVEQSRDALAVSERIVVAFGPSSLRLRDVAVAKGQLAEVLLGYHQVNEALALSGDALALSERILTEFGPSSERLRDVLLAKHRVANVLLRHDQPDEALSLARDVLALAERNSAEFGPSSLRLHDMWVAKDQLAEVLLGQDQMGEALAMSRDALALSERLVSEFGASPNRLFDVSIATVRVADVLLGQNRADEAIALYREALALTERILVAFGPSSKRLSDVCASKFQLAEVLSDQDMHDEAIELFREAEALRDRILAGTWLAAPEYTVQGD